MYLQKVDKHLHIVSPDVPFPVDYGGVFDIYYKLKTLHRHHIKIHLHCFEYRRSRQTELEKYCSEVTYYSRVTGVPGISLRLPYIVSSRRNVDLLNNLLKDDYPILFEGVHTSWPVFDQRFANRKILVRLFNIEYVYYHQLYVAATFSYKKFYYYCESLLLKSYEKKLGKRVSILALSEEDARVYKELLNAVDTEFLPAFLPLSDFPINTGKGDYCLYHGNLSVAENESAIIWLINHVFKELSIPLVIAGKSPSEKLKSLCVKRNNICLVANPSDHEMQDLITRAQVHVLPSFNKTGVKLKVLNALFNGRHCVVNKEALPGTMLERLCHVATDAGSYLQLITRLFAQPFETSDIQLRKEVLGHIYDNDANARKLIQWIS